MVVMMIMMTIEIMMIMITLAVMMIMMTIEIMMIMITLAVMMIRVITHLTLIETSTEQADVREVNRASVRSGQKYKNVTYLQHNLLRKPSFKKTYFVIEKKIKGGGVGVYETKLLSDQACKLNTTFFDIQSWL